MPDPSKRILELLTELDGILESRIAGTGDVTVADAMGITELHEAVESALSDDRIWDLRPSEERDAPGGAQDGEPPPGHYVCWCGVMVHSSGAIGPLYEANGDLHECDYRARLFATPTPQVERGALVDALEALAEIHWRDGGCSDIPADDFQGVLERHGLLVEVPADEATREAWDTETMLVLAWSSAALREEESPVEEDDE